MPRARPTKRDRVLDAHIERVLLEWAVECVSEETQINARNTLIEKHLGMICAIAKQFHLANYGFLDLHDLIAAGCVGMAEAIRRYDLKRRVRLSTRKLRASPDALQAMKIAAVIGSR